MVLSILSPHPGNKQRVDDVSRAHKYRKKSTDLDKLVAGLVSNIGEEEYCRFLSVVISLKKCEMFL